MTDCPNQDHTDRRAGLPDAQFTMSLQTRKHTMSIPTTFYAWVTPDATILTDDNILFDSIAEAIDNAPGDESCDLLKFTGEVVPTVTLECTQCGQIIVPLLPGETFHEAGDRHEAENAVDHEEQSVWSAFATLPEGDL